MTPLRWSHLVALVGLVGGYLYAGLDGLLLVALLAVLEVSLSFDNAVVNARVLERMSKRWQTLFLTVGFLIAVVGVRLVFPILLVSATAGRSPADILELAWAQGSPDDPGSYAHLLMEAHPAIAAFGGTFLAMVFAGFMFADNEIRWLHWIERPLARIGKLESVPVILTLSALVAVAALAPADHQTQILIAGLAGLVVFLIIDDFATLFASEARLLAAGGMALFMYLNVLDASFSFDGVVGAFAITSNPVLIMIGLGIGAIYVRSLTILLVEHKTLGTYRYLEHGAHWAIGALAALLLVSTLIEVPEVVTGLIGVLFVGLAFAHSVYANRREAA